MSWPKGVPRGPQSAEHVAKRFAAMRHGPVVCIETACGKRVLAGGLCSMHYSRIYRHGSLAKPAHPTPWNKGRQTGLSPWRGVKRGPQSPAWREKISIANRKPKSPEHAAKILGRMWHGPKPEYGGITFRSSYEVRFAKVLDGCGIAWQYEPTRFNLGTCSYLPDFYLPTLGMYVEVKGYFSEESQRKVTLFWQRHPEHPLAVVMKRTLTQLEATHGRSGVEDQLTGLVAQQCAIATA